MTIDPFTEAARAEAERQFPLPVRAKRYDGTPEGVGQEGFEQGAEWARAHLAAQEPTDAEVLAAREAVREVWRKQNRLDLGHVGLMEAYARAALSAARAARRDEEKR